MAVEFGQVIEGVGVAKFAGVDQAHEEIADMGTVFGFVKQGVFAVKDCFFGSSPNLVGENAISLPIASRFFKAWANKSIKNRRSEDRNPPAASTEYTPVSSRLFLGRLLLGRAYLRFTDIGIMFP